MNRQTIFNIASTPKVKALRTKITGAQSGEQNYANPGAKIFDLKI